MVNKIHKNKKKVEKKKEKENIARNGHQLLPFGAEAALNRQPNY